MCGSIHCHSHHFLKSPDCTLPTPPVGPPEVVGVGDVVKHGDLARRERQRAVDVIVVELMLDCQHLQGFVVGHSVRFMVITVKAAALRPTGSASTQCASVKKIVSSTPHQNDRQVVQVNGLIRNKR